MEVKINKDIREFSESIFFGLSLRQFIFSVLACIVAVILYFILKPFCGIETLSWVCIRFCKIQRNDIRKIYCCSYKVRVFNS